MRRSHRPFPHASILTILLSGGLLAATPAAPAQATTPQAQTAQAQTAQAQTAQVTTPQATTAGPSLQDRLDRVVERLEAKRIEWHIPGMSFALVRGDEVLLCRGFGVADVSTNRPVDEHTLFAAGSTTKAFTATLIGMLVDEGRMGWDDPPSRYLSGFHLADAEADAQLAVRDLLCHRVGFANLTLLWYGNDVTRGELITAMGRCTLLHPFRSEFNYSNLCFLAAGEASAVAAGTDWDTLLARRLFEPLGMSRSCTTLEAARASGNLAMGYGWDEAKSSLEHQPMRELSAVAPAGAINSSTTDMARWVQFQLGRGEFDGRRLLSRAAHEETWTRQISVGANGYGLGWFLRDWQGRRAIDHAGGIDGFTAEVALLPEEGLGFVLLMNLAGSPLGEASRDIVFKAMLGELNEPQRVAVEENLAPLVGTYTGNFAHFHDAEFKVLERNGRLAIDVPGQMVFELEPPDAEGRRPFSMTDQIAVRFNRDEDAHPYSVTIFQSGYAFELPRQGAETPVEIDLDAARRCLGTFRSDTLGDLRVLIQNNRLAVDVPGQMIYELYPPDAEGRLILRVKDTLWVRFERDAQGQVDAMVFTQNGVDQRMERVASASDDPLPTLASVMALFHRGAGAAHAGRLRNFRLTGTFRLEHMGVEGRYTRLATSDGRLRDEIDLGRYGVIRSILSPERAWVDSSMLRDTIVDDAVLTDMRRSHPCFLFGDWRNLYQQQSVLRREERDGRSVYVVRLKPDGSPADQLTIDAGTGELVAAVMSPLSAAGTRVTTTLRFSDYREVEGVRMPFRVESEWPMAGNMTIECDSVEANLDLPAGAFDIPGR